MAGEEPIISGMAGRYASALFDLAQSSGAVDAVGADLARFEALVAESADLARLVRSPVFSSEEQTKAIIAVLERAGIGGLAANFLKLAAQNRRLFAVHDMIRAYKGLVARARGETSAEVVVAQPLSDSHLATLKDALRSATGKDVALDVKVDPGLIGGLTVKIGSRMIDASLKTKLQSIKIAMKEVG
ncbi:F0F1 ATP synthase subunit delta [Labrys wisconsinensis]|uniref:ATP synthase subunit delta n=1 Tax=Labrys wisconsinensis TaxID=425677 RepID=A0ABU0J507_9HYPH|nr:F0F1 ATP synthase subunit delta [Labrys wisconsinensis]MDQ0468272.1 F-type H+-transporting ATPase subunit delta [Labrys wisconsinensis]